MKLATIQSVLDTIDFKTNTDIERQIGLALESATSDLESHLRTDFTRETSVDTFLIQEKQSQPGLFEYNWRLSSGFVDVGETFTARVAATIPDLNVSDYESVEEDSLINYELGLVTLLTGPISSIRRLSGGALRGNLCQISYTKGFTTDGDGVAEDVPGWLEQAAVTRAIVILDTINPELRHHEESQFSLKQLQMLYASLVQKHIRYAPKFDNPVMRS